MAEDRVTVERVLPAPRAFVWALLADTDRYDRALGLGHADYEWREIEGRRQYVATAKQSGMQVSWIEDPYQWIEGRFLRGQRRFLKGPADTGGLRIDVTDHEQGTLATVSAFGDASSWLLKVLSPLVRRELRRRLNAYIDSVATVVDAQAGTHDSDIVPVMQARLSLQRSRELSGTTTAINRIELTERASRLARVDDDVRARLVETLGERPDDEVAQLRPFELARAWKLDRREVLRGFLHGTRAGLIDLMWQVNCPVCRVATSVTESLEQVEQDVHCDTCNIRYDIDFAAHVEAVFRCNAAIRSVEPQVYCASSPAFRPHVVAQLRASAGTETEQRIDLRDGRLHVRTLARHAAADLSDERAPAILRIRITDDAVDLSAEGEADGEPTKLILESVAAEDAYVLLERGAWSTDAVLGSVIATFPDFLDLFATEAPAAGHELTVGHLTLLFSDLTGSTALYESVGDARAYSIVQEHFRAMTEVIAQNDGAVVKTMGDAVMASFASPAQAVQAAMAMVGEHARRCGEHPIGVKLGVHAGPCLAIRANDRLDFFGTTVNVAARLQGKAAECELVMTAELAAHPAVRPLLEPFRRREFQTALKGIEKQQDLIAFSLAEPATGS